MPIFEYLEAFVIIIIISFLLYLHYKVDRRRRKPSEPTAWPVIGMLPAALQNTGKAHDYITEVLNEVGGTYEFIGPWLSNTNMLFTSDPANIHHIFSKNFSNYPKGREFQKIFEMLGDGIFNADFKLWEVHRKTTMSLLAGAQFHRSLEQTVWGKVETSLLPVLEHFNKQGIEVDLQEVFQRFTFDNVCQIVLDYDPNSLSIEMPYIPCEKAFSDAMEPLMYRHVIPEKIWKVQNWLGIGREKMLIQAFHAFDDFIYRRIDLWEKEEIRDSRLLDIFAGICQESDIGTSRSLRDFLRDTSLNLMIAGRDTTSTCLTWLFYLIAQDPSAEAKILHAALCESLRLYPPVALEHKSPAQPDVLPSGHRVQQNAKIIFSFYTVGRMESVWGKDCLEFKPERWITPRGGIKHEPSYKFPAFNAGPRTCLGKEMAFIQMKAVAAAVVYHYGVRLAAGLLPVLPRDSIILQAKNGVKVRLFKRCNG